MLYYTGALQDQAQQEDPKKSLGGYISSSNVPNDMLGNLFGTIDINSIVNKNKTIRIIAFQNQTGNIIQSLKVYTETPNDCNTFFKIGLIKASIHDTGSCEIPYFESISNDASSPIYVELNEVEGSTNYVELNDIDPLEFVGIFIQRNINVNNNQDVLNSDGSVKVKNCNDFFEDYKTMNPDEYSESIIKNEIDIIFDYTLI